MATATTSTAAKAAPLQPPTFGRFLHSKFVQSKQAASRASHANPRLPRSVRDFVPGPWTVHLLLLTHPGMRVSRAVELTKRINRVDAAARSLPRALQIPTFAQAVAEVAGGGV